MESKTFISMDLNKNKKYELEILWFLGDWLYEGKKLYVKYGHLGFRINRGNIYGFGPIDIYDNDIFGGKYFGVISNDNYIFNHITDLGTKINKVKSYISEDVYMQIQGWDNGIINYKNINNIVYGILWLQELSIGIKKNSTILNGNYANCVSFLKYLNPIIKSKNKNIALGGIEILGDFQKLTRSYIY